MKKIIFITVFGLLYASAFPQKMEIGLNGIAGYTVLNVQSVVGEPLTNSSQFSYGGNLLFLYHCGSSLAVGLDAGFHRLYYWEYSFSGFGYGTEYRWGTEETIHFGPMAELKKNNFYVQGGLNLRIFTDGTGTVPALLLGAGYAIPISGILALPIGIRTDVVFGSGTPLAVNLSAGLRIKIGQ